MSELSAGQYGARACRQALVDLEKFSNIPLGGTYGLVFFAVFACAELPRRVHRDHRGSKGVVIIPRTSRRPPRTRPYGRWWRMIGREVGDFPGTTGRRSLNFRIWPPEVTGLNIVYDRYMY
jgi:hypothetical protein